MQKRIKKSSSSYVALALSTALLASCSGGGGPPPPLPPTNTAPSAIVSASVTSQQEGQSFGLDASGSTDANGDTLTYAWSQTAGTTVAIPDDTMATLTALSVPELTATETATFEVAVNDGQATSTASVTITFENISQTPRFTGALPFATSTTFNNPVNSIFLSSSGRSVLVETEDQAAGAISVTDTELLPTGNIASVVTGSILGSFTQPTSFSDIGFGSSGGSTSSRGFIALEEGADRMRRFVQTTFGGDYTVVEDVQVSAPCAGSNKVPVVGPYRSVHIGQRGNGFSLLAFPFSLSPPPFIYKTAGTTESFCALYATERPLQGSIFNDSNFRYIPDVVALDVDTNTIHAYEADSGNSTDASQYQLRESIPLDLQTTDSLQFVTSAPVGTWFNNGSGLALLYTDGVHDDTHRLIVIGLDADRQIYQETYSWPIGVPVDVILDNMDADSFPELVVITNTSPDAVVFTPQAGGSSSFLPLSGPSYFEIGLGATQAIPAASGSFGENLLIIA